MELLQNNYYRASRILRFRSKPFLNPQRSIFNRFRRARALSPSQRLYSTVIKGHRHSEIDKNHLSRSSRVRDLARTHLWLSYHAEHSADETTVGKDPRGLNNDYFAARCVRKVPCADIEPSSASQLQEMSELNQSDDLELLQSNCEIWEI